MHIFTVYHIWNICLSLIELVYIFKETMWQLYIFWCGLILNTFHRQCDYLGPFHRFLINQSDLPPLSTINAPFPSWWSLWIHWQIATSWRTAESLQCTTQAICRGLQLQQWYWGNPGLNCQQTLLIWSLVHP